MNSFKDKDYGMGYSRTATITANAVAVEGDEGVPSGDVILTQEDALRAALALLGPTSQNAPIGVEESGNAKMMRTYANHVRSDLKAAITYADNLDAEKKAKEEAVEAVSKALKGANIQYGYVKPSAAALYAAGLRAS